MPFFLNQLMLIIISHTYTMFLKKEVYFDQDLTGGFNKQEVYLDTLYYKIASQY